MNVTPENYRRIRRQANRVINQVIKKMADLNKQYGHDSGANKKFQKLARKDFRALKRNAFKAAAQ